MQGEVRKVYASGKVKFRSHARDTVTPLADASSALRLAPETVLNSRVLPGDQHHITPHIMIQAILQVQSWTTIY
jgi:hypothetical protein